MRRDCRPNNKSEIYWQKMLKFISFKCHVLCCNYAIFANKCNHHIVLTCSTCRNNTGLACMCNTSLQDVGLTSAKCKRDKCWQEVVSVCLLCSLPLSDHTPDDYFRHNAAHQRQVYSALFCILNVNLRLLFLIFKPLCLWHLNVVIKPHILISQYCSKVNLIHYIYQMFNFK